MGPRPPDASRRDDQEGFEQVQRGAFPASPLRSDADHFRLPSAGVPSPGHLREVSFASDLRSKADRGARERFEGRIVVVDRR
eukprot:2651594-Pyramimonas_sp.AAC.1